ncbi:hypothetical protein ELI_3632 [Eubacterium callanderi]|uniref:Uncharacterized protein n=1 Tax=Eubacterium callanderi TaxID=53442 RepID=E3GG48_9FIRM|nr:hypothetical protein ELI_3632 [Eubacterium callanderi]GFZ23839.1 hypothetical protein CMETHOX_17620 [[Clostridium] methoxybenzovorans]
MRGLRPVDKKCAQKFLINKLERGQIFTVKNGCAYEKTVYAISTYTATFR